MSDTLLRIYNLLPAPGRVVAANFRGLYLRRWRYGPETERLVATALEREYWNSEQWKVWQEKQLGYLLHRAATEVPYYRDHWTARRRRGDRASWTYLENWPILEKETVRANPSAFVAEDCNVRRMFHVHTSGTTGKPLDLAQSRETIRAWYALFEARCRRWHGVSRRDRWATLAGQLITPVYQRRPPFWVWNVPLKQLYMSSYHLAPDLTPYYLDALKQYDIRYLEGYSSSLSVLARDALMSGKKLNMAVALTNAEPVLDYQRAAISDAFQTSVRETYGMAEMVAAASECEKGSLHIWPEAGLIEIVDRDLAVNDGTAGDLVCTGLLNADMPLIRYRVGDRASVPTATTCPCGRRLPLLGPVEGRVDDVLYTVDGRRIGRLDPVFKANLPIREAQIIQESLTRIRVRYVPASDLTSGERHSIVERLQARMGDMEVILDEVPSIPRSANGKFRAVISRISGAHANKPCT